ncbi:hypothetical protein I4U23_011854 [Adineta vaga]|nr:hypothetical protein I4U23_011854 [Adineta vaga]
MKRERNEIIQNYHELKKQKMHHYNVNTTKTILENLANEIIYEIFDYLDIFHIYDGFFDLNRRFKNLLINSNFPVQVNTSTITKTKFQYYYKKVILPNKNRINHLRLSNEFITDIIFSPSRLIIQFLQIESLVLDNIIYRSFKNISIYLMHLPKLRSLTLSFSEKLEHENVPFGHIFNLSNLKYFKITYIETNEYSPEPIDFTNYGHSSIEYLVINTHFHVESFNSLLFRFPKLRHLSIDSLRSSFHITKKIYQQDQPIPLEHLKFVSLKLDLVDLNNIEDMFKRFFRYVEVLHLATIQTCYECLNAKRWEQLISNFMPNLRVYDVYFHGFGLSNQLTFHELVNQFNSPFWTNKRWFFTHQHDDHEDLNNGIFYSINPYRSKDFTFYWQSNKEFCSYLRKTNFNSVQHVRIGSKQVTNNPVDYFPNATQLSVINHLGTFNQLFSSCLRSIIPLKNLTKVAIESFDCSLEGVMQK